MGNAGNNLRHYYEKGDEDIVLPWPEKAADINRIGAEYGYPGYQYKYGWDLKREGKAEEAGIWFRKAAEGGERSAFPDAGDAWRLGNGGPKDMARAAWYYEQGLNDPANGEYCAGWLGILYYQGEGVPQDYARAFRLLKWADDTGKKGNWLVYYLGDCYANGKGTQQDYAAARRYLEWIDWNCPDGFYLLGYLYARGLGGPKDIAKGVELLQKAGNQSRAREELKRYKRTLFGKWVER